MRVIITEFYHLDGEKDVETLQELAELIEELEMSLSYYSILTVSAGQVAGKERVIYLTQFEHEPNSADV